MKVAIVGAGWSGCHLALELSRQGHQVLLFERQREIMSGVSGDFGIRLHKGPHYPRSKATRLACQMDFERFRAEYPELIIEHEYAVYAQGTLDATASPSKVSNETFAAVCHELEACRQIAPPAWGYAEIEAAYDIDEPSAVLGSRLREYFVARLAAAGVQVHCDCHVREITGSIGQHELLLNIGQRIGVERVINATGYQSLIPQQLGAGTDDEVEVGYQVCLGLLYQDATPARNPFSFIVMDGWFPCLMPRIEHHDDVQRSYVLTHGSYTILGTFPTVEEAQALLHSLEDVMVEDRIRPLAEAEMCRFWPAFTPRMRYTGWKGVVLAKLRTRSEFRSSVVFEQAGVIYVFPGKISNVFQAGDEVLALLSDEKSKARNGLRYIEDGVFDSAQEELLDKPSCGERNTLNLQTYEMFEMKEPV